MSHVNIEAKEIKRIRDLLGFTQEELAKELGVTKITVVRWESGSRACKGASAMKIYDLEQKKHNTMIRKTTTIFSVNTESLSRLDGRQAIRVFRDFLYCEVRRLKIPVTDVDISEREIADGGIDARVRVNAISNSSTLKSGSNYFQVKAGESATPWRPSWIHKELFGKKTLGDEIRRCLEENGRYVLVCFGIDLTPQQISQAEENLVNSFTKCGYPTTTTEVWGQQQLISMIEPFPSLCLRIMGRDDYNFKSYDSWKLEHEMSSTFYLDEDRESLIRDIRDLLFKDEIRHVRLVGDAGIGKTKLMLEALSVPALSSYVAYVKDPDDFLKSSLFNNLCKSDTEYHLILVVDDCPKHKFSEIWNSLRNYSDNCRLISIDQRVYRTNDGWERVFECPPLSDRQIIQILENYVGPTYDLRRWSEFCSGSPRIAHAIGQNLRHNSEDILLSPSTVSIWEKFIYGNSPLKDESKIFVLKHLALFERFGFEEPVQEEARFIHKMINKGDPNISWEKFQIVIEELKSQGILKGKTTLHITPKALHVYLWIEFWKHGRGMCENLQEMPDSLLVWFGLMFSYAKSSEIALNEIEKLFRANGPFYKTDMLHPKACMLLNELSEAFPDQTLQCIENTLMLKEREELLEFKKGRQYIVFALEKMAWRPNYFSRAATVLLHLAHADNSTHANNAKGTFAALFHLTPGVAPTAASPEERLSFLEISLNSDSFPIRQIGLTGYEEALSIPAHAKTRLVGSEYQGLERTLSAWAPKTWEEYKTPFYKAWGDLFKNTRQWEVIERSKVNSILIHKGEYLLKEKGYEWLEPNILKTFQDLIDDEATDKKYFIETLASIQRYPNNISQNALSAIRNLEDQITGVSFASRIKRWVNFATHNDRSEEENIIKSNKQFEILALDALTNEDEFKNVLPDLVKEFNISAFEFGKILSIADQEKKLLLDIVDAYRQYKNEGSIQFLSGYLKIIFESDPAAWNDIIDNLIKDSAFANLIGRVIVSSGFNDFSIEKLLVRYDQNHLDIESLSCFRFSNGLKNLKIENIQEIVQRLYEAKKITSGLEFLEYVFCKPKDSKQLPLDLAFNLLKAPTDHEYDGYFYWKVVAKYFIAQYHQKQEEILKIIIVRISSEVNQFYSDREIGQLVRDIIKSNPDSSWYVFSSIFEKLDNLELFRFVEWFKIHLSLTMFPFRKISEWLAELPEKRAPLIARISPPGFIQEECVVRELLNSYGEDENVQQNLLGTFFAGSWTGPASEFFQAKKDSAIEWLGKETSMRVKRWLDKYIRVLSAEIDNTRIREERE